MFHQQALYERSLIVRMDRVNDKPENNMPRLPEGLKGIGMGLGENGRPLTDVSSKHLKLSGLNSVVIVFVSREHSYECAKCPDTEQHEHESNEHHGTRNALRP